MKEFELQPKELDFTNYKHRTAKEEDYSTLVDEPFVVRVDGEVKIVYLELENVLDCTEIVGALERIKFGTSARTDGLMSTSATIGYLPRNTIRRDFCTASGLAHSQPEEHAIVCKYAAQVDKFYHDLHPTLYNQHKETVQEKVLGDYRIRGSVFTSGIINKDNQLAYHFDTGNFKNVWSCMLVFKNRIEGGHLSLPEFDMGVYLRHNSLFMFDGQGILHGVTPIHKLTPDAFRYSIVYYSMQQMWNCEPLTDELARIRNVKTQRERRRAEQMRKLKQLDLQAGVQHPVFICAGDYSPTKAKAIPIFKSAGIPATVLVEPSREQSYREAYPAANIQPKSDEKYPAALAVLKHLEEDEDQFWLVEGRTTSFFWEDDEGEVHRIPPNPAMFAAEQLSLESEMSVRIPEGANLHRRKSPYIDLPRFRSRVPQEKSHV